MFSNNGAKMIQRLSVARVDTLGRIHDGSKMSQVFGFLDATEGLRHQYDSGATLLPSHCRRREFR
jgi:hypothetical protein